MSEHQSRSEFDHLRAWPERPGPQGQERVS